MTFGMCFPQPHQVTLSLNSFVISLESSKGSMIFKG